MLSIMAKLSRHYFSELPKDVQGKVKDKKGKRIETAEVNIKKFYIAQQYGKHDSFSEWHEDIKNFINDNMWRFKQASMERRAV